MRETMMFVAIYSPLLTFMAVLGTVAFVAGAALIITLTK